MTGANQFLWEHCEKTLSEIRRAYQGVSHSVNCCNAETADCLKATDELRERVTSQAQELREANAAIGKLQGEAVGLEQKTRAAFAELRKAIDQRSPDRPVAPQGD